jgi:hypothetical protein
MSRLHRATTRHVASAFPFVGSDATAEGVVIGMDNLTGEVFAYDPWVASDRGIISGPNVVVFGTIGSGKSAVVKTYLLRSLVFGTHARVLDPKGEYVRVAEAVPGSQVVRVGLDGAVQINPLDPAIRPAQQRALIEALVEATAGTRLHVIERAVLAASLDHVRQHSQEPTLAGLRDALWAPPDDVVARHGNNRDRVADAAAPSAAALDLVLEGELATLVGGASSVPFDPACPLLVADVSAIVPLGGTEVAAAMAVVGTWLQALLATRAGRQVVVLDECWRLLRDASTARWLQASAKLAREYQAQLVTVFHRLSDLAAVGDEGSEQVQIARGLVSDAETRVLYRQTPGDVAALGDVLGLSGEERALIPRLGRAVGLWRVGARSTVVRHLLSSWGAPLVETEAHRRHDLDTPTDETPPDADGAGFVGAADAGAVT